MSEWKEGDIAEWGGKLMVCVPQHTKGCVYRKGAYWLYTEKAPQVKLSKEDLEYFRKQGERLRRERKIYNRNQAAHISDNYGKDEVLIGGRRWWITEHISAPLKEAKKDLVYKGQMLSYKTGEVVKKGLPGAGIKRSAQLIAIVLMAFFAFLVYIIFVKGKGAEGVSVSAVGK